MPSSVVSEEKSNLNWRAARSSRINDKVCHRLLLLIDRLASNATLLALLPFLLETWWCEAEISRTSTSQSVIHLHLGMLHCGQSGVVGPVFGSTVFHLLSRPSANVKRMCASVSVQIGLRAISPAHNKPAGWMSWFIGQALSRFSSCWDYKDQHTCPKLFGITNRYESVFKSS